MSSRPSANRVEVFFTATLHPSTQQGTKQNRTHQTTNPHARHHHNQTKNTKQGESRMRTPTYLAAELRLPTNWLDYTILGIYFVVVLGIGFAAPPVGEAPPGLLPVRALPPRLDPRARFLFGQPGAHRDPGHGGQQRPVRRLHRPLVLDRRHPRHGLSRP